MNASALVGIGALAAAAGALALRLSKSSAVAPLSARRKAVLAFLSEVVPSQYGSEGFKRIAPNYDPDDPNLPRNAAGELTYTTCGELPCAVGRFLRADKCITSGGLDAMRDNGRKVGAWVDANGSNRPRPADPFAIQNSTGLIVHVGIIVDASGPVWKTADAGQGGRGAGQRAEYILRPYDAKTVTVGGPGTKYVEGQGWTGASGPRRVAGWYDIDKAPGATP